MASDAFNRGAGGQPDPGYTGQNKLIYDTARDQRIRDQQKRLNDEAQMRRKAFGGGPASPGDTTTRASADSAGGASGLLALVGLLAAGAIALLSLALAPPGAVLALFAWPVPALMRATLKRDWRIGVWRSWLVMFLGLWAFLTASVVVGALCWHFAVRGGAGTGGPLTWLVLPLGGIVETLRTTLEAGDPPWEILSLIAPERWAMALPVVLAPALAGFAGMLIYFERPAFNGITGFSKAIVVAIAATLFAFAGAVLVLAALGFTLVQLFG